MVILTEADDIDRPLPRRRILLVGSMDSPKWAIFECPCGTGHEIMLNLDQRRRPYWTLRNSLFSGATLQPSIDSAESHIRCHYFIRRGKVQWV